MVQQETIEQIRRAVPIVEAIGKVVELRKSGRNHVGLCPFHAEKSPSFSVNADKNLFHCFGCQAGGDVFAFVMRHRGLDFHGALTELGQQAGIEVEALSPQQRQEQQEKARLSAVNACALRFFTLALLHPCGAAARAYLTSRRVPVAQVKARCVGYGHRTAPFLAYLKRAGHSPQDAQAAGLLGEAGGRLWCEDRLIFPIYTPTGEVAGFGGRRLNEAADVPKYINSRETALFHKRRLLYGFYEAHAAIRQRRQVVIMEGYTDVLAAQRSGVDTAVAVLGTAFSQDHLRGLQRLCDRVILCFDADRAGQAAAQKSSQIVLQAGLQARIAVLPAGDDPDSLTRRPEGAEILRTAVADAQPAVEYFLEALFGGDAPLSIEQRAAAARQLQPLLQALGSGLERDLYTERLAARVGVRVEQLQRDLQRIADRPGRQGGAKKTTSTGTFGEQTAAPEGLPHRSYGPTTADKRPEDPAQGPPRRLPPQPYEIDLLRELLLFPGLRARFGEVADYAVTDSMQQLCEALAGSEAPLQQILQEHLGEGRAAAALLRVQPRNSQQDGKVGPSDDLGGDEAASRHTFDAVLASLKRHRLDVALQELVQEIRQCESTGEATDRLLRRKQELTARKRALRKLQ
jgi:DNA primase